MFLAQSPNTNPVIGRQVNDSISDFSTDSNSNSLHHDEVIEKRKKPKKQAAVGKKKSNKEKGENVLDKVRDAQVINYLCHLFEDTSQGDERIDRAEIEAVYDNHRNFQECYEKLKERV